MNTATVNDCAAVLPFAELECFMGFDWGQQTHAVVVVDRQGRIVLEMEFAHSAEGWMQLRDKLRPLGPRIGVAIETCRGPAVDRLMMMALTLFPMNPKAAERYRDRKAPSGVKDDLLDAWAFADALRTDGKDWRPLRPDDPQTQLIRLLCRDQIALIEQRTALVNQLRAALHEYYPAALEAFENWTVQGAWAFVIQFPTSELLLKAGKRKWQNFLHAHRMCQADKTQERLETFVRAGQFACPNPAVVTAKSLLAVSLVKQLQTLESQIQEYQKRIDKLFGQHPDHDLFASLPGTGPKLAPRLLGELGGNREVFESAQALQSYAGTAPVTRKSGKKRAVNIRWMCNRTLRATVHMFADHSRGKCAWAEAYYQQKIAEGKSVATALRCLGQRWLKILWTMWQKRVPYDEALHLRNMTEHGSWVLGQTPRQAAAN